MVWTMSLPVSPVADMVPAEGQGRRTVGGERSDTLTGAGRRRDDEQDDEVDDEQDCKIQSQDARSSCS